MFDFLIDILPRDDDGVPEPEDAGGGIAETAIVGDPGGSTVEYADSGEGAIGSRGDDIAETRPANGQYQPEE
jgi:hypothetical protein